MRIIKLLFFLLLTFNLFSQEIKLEGVVMDVNTSEKLGGVHMQLINQADSKIYTAVSKLNGTYSFTELENGDYLLITSYIGYKKNQQKVEINSSLELRVELQKELIDLGEVVVSSLRQDKNTKAVPVPLEIVGQEQIQLASSFTASDILGQEPGVALARDGVWATGISIRGLSQQRIVMLVDGNRIETATDLMASMSFFDINDIERIEVIKGASSSLHGTGAMGGIVNVITNKAYFNSSSYFNGSFNGGYSSVNELFNRSLSFKVGSKKWYASVTGTLRDANDVNTPEGIIENSQFEDKSISASLGYKLTQKQIVEVKYQYFDADNVGIPGGAALPGPSTATYKDAKREMVSVNYQIIDLAESFKKLNFRYFHQNIVRDVDLVPNIFTSTATSITTPELFTPTGTHVTDGFQIQSDWSFGKNNNFILGLDAWRRKLETSREKFIRVDMLDSEGNISATNNIVRGETPIPESCFGSAGLYLQNEQKLLNDDLTVIIGGRIDGIRIANQKAFDYDYLIVNDVLNDTPPNQRITFEESEEYKLSWSTNVGFLYQLIQDLDLSLNAGRSFRAPSLEESFKYIDLGSKVQLGDPNLDPEKGYSLDIGMRVWKPRFQFKVNGFINWLTDMIVEESGEFIYSYTTGVIDTIPALINTNVNKASLYGLDFSFQYNFYSNFVLHGSGSYVRGKDTENNVDLPLITPANGRLGLRYNLPKYFGFDLIAIGFADQNKVAEGESETKGFARFDMRLNSSVINLDFLKLQFFGGIENIGDRAYTNHLATNRGSISIEPGRNIYVKMKVLF